jgi:hypothetical protein
VLVEHSPVEVGRTGRDKIVRRVLETQELALCAPCLARVRRARRQHKVVAGIALSGIVIASGYMVGTFAGAPTPVVLAFLFGGFGLFLASAEIRNKLERSADAEPLAARAPARKVSPCEAYEPASR